MDSARSLHRRHLLAGGAAVALAALAGCVGDTGTGGDTSEEDDPDGGDTGTGGDTSEEDDPDGGDTGTGGDTSEEDDPDGGDTGTGGDSSGSGSEGLNLREANVVDVAFEEQAGEYSFDVTLHHDDDGEEGYADWWQVERLDGTQLGRRELRHAHSRQPFTRSGTVAVPDGVDCVVVRGHDQTHGYGGQVALVNLGSGETRTLDRGSERESLGEGDCPAGDPGG